MRNRLNVVFQGRRTTARFPDYLWRLALFACDFDDEALASDVRRFLHSCDITDRSASEVVQGLLVNVIELHLASAGFNPGTAAHYADLAPVSRCGGSPAISRLTPLPPGPPARPTEPK